MRVRGPTWWLAAGLVLTLAAPATAADCSYHGRYSVDGKAAKRYGYVTGGVTTFIYTSLDDRHVLRSRSTDRYTGVTVENDYMSAPEMSLGPTSQHRLESPSENHSMELMFDIGSGYDDGAMDSDDRWARDWARHAHEKCTNR